MLGHRLRRWPNIKQTLGQFLQQQILRLFNYHIAYTLQSDRVLIFEGSNLPIKF